jgi:hypothetical protein
MPVASELAMFKSCAVLCTPLGIRYTHRHCAGLRLRNVRCAHASRTACRPCVAFACWLACLALLLFSYRISSSFWQVLVSSLGSGKVWTDVTVVGSLRAARCAASQACSCAGVLMLRFACSVSRSGFSQRCRITIVALHAPFSGFAVTLAPGTALLHSIRCDRSRVSRVGV